MNRTNILLLTTDQQRFDTIAAQGYPHMITPNLDRLVQEGTSYQYAYSPNPACIPARHCIVSGRYSREHRMDDNYFDCVRTMPAGLPTIASLLSEAGYETIAVGKMHFQPARNHNGFGKMELMEELPRFREDDEYAMFLKKAGYGELASLHGVRNLLYMIPQTPLQPEELCGTPWVADRLIHHIQTNGGRRPFFYWGSWIAPHAPLSLPKRFADLYRDRELPGAIPPDQNPKAITMENSRIGDYTTPKIARRGREYYYGAITWVDEQIGRVLGALREASLEEDTLVVFTSDHGELLGDHGSFHKFQHYEGSSRIPLILRFPGRLSAGESRVEFADLNDLLPTFLDAAEVEAPQGLPGSSLLDLSGGRDRSVQFVEHSHGSKRWSSLRNQRYKYVWFFGGGLEELYDLQNDPEERHNLAEDPMFAQIKQALHALLTEYEEKWGLEEDVKNSALAVFPPYEAKPRLPASFPVFPKNLPKQEQMLSPEEEILRAVANEPVSRLCDLSWQDWVAQGHFSEQQIQLLLRWDQERQEG